MRCTPLIESQNLGKMSVPLKAHKRERRGEGAGRERNEERVSKLKRKSLTVTSLSVTIEKKDLSRLLKSTCLY